MGHPLCYSQITEDGIAGWGVLQDPGALPIPGHAKRDLNHPAHKGRSMMDVLAGTSIPSSTAADPARSANTLLFPAMWSSVTELGQGMIAWVDTSKEVVYSGKLRK